MAVYKGVIVEGSDCSGKTTLVKRLKAAISASGWDVIDMGHKPGDQFRRYARVYLGSEHLLLDRSHYSEVVYSALWRGGSPFVAWENSLLDHLARRFVLVLCIAPEELLKKRYLEREYAQVTKAEELPVVQSKFLDLLTPRDAVIYDSTSPESLEMTVKRVISVLGIQEDEAEILKASSDHLRGETQERFIILEGANGSGKSTLSKVLKINLVGWSVKTLDYLPNVDSFDRYLAEYLNADKVIFDRAHFSEVVYGDMFRAAKHFSEQELEHLNRFVRARAITILCEAGPQIVLDRILASPHPKHINPSRIAEVQDRFRRCIASAQVDPLVVDTGDARNVQDIAARIRNRLSGTAYSEMAWDK